MSNRKHPVLAFCGWGRAGKDTAAEWFRDHTPLRFEGGCSWTVMPIVAKELNMTVEECYETRHDRRDFLYHWCNEFRKDDPARIIRMCLEHSDVVCGVRDGIELFTARDEGLIDLIVWVKRSITPYDKTVKYTEDDCDITVTNNGSYEEFYAKLARLAKTMGIPVYQA